MRDVHWEEGMFLRPHHMQAQQRFSLEQLGLERTLHLAHPWGVHEIRVGTEDLEAKRLVVTRLRAVMRSGLTVDSEACGGIDPIDFGELFERTSEPIEFLLGVPLATPEMTQVLKPGDDRRLRRRYRLHKLGFRDESDPESRADLELRVANARILVPDEDLTGLEYFPLVRVKRGTGDAAGVPQLDTDFVPPCVSVSGSAVIASRLNDLATQFGATMNEQRRAMAREAAPPLESRVRLQTLARHWTRVRAINEAPRATSPAVLHEALSAALAELAAIDERIEPIRLPDFRHEAPGPALLDLIDQVRPRLRGEEGDVLVLRVPFEPVMDALVATVPPQAAQASTARFFIAITSTSEPMGLSAFVQERDKFKVQSEETARFPTRGVALREDRSPPAQLPPVADTIYFQLDVARDARAEDSWRTILSEGRIALYSPERERFAHIERAELCVILSRREVSS